VKITDGQNVLAEVALPNGYDLNDTYVDMLRDAMEGFTLNQPRAPIPLADGIAALTMGVSALESSRTAGAVGLNTITEVS
jgi:hypothetical protein